MSEYSNTSYEVESILDKKIENQMIYYKIKWKGYSFNECTWEPEHHLSENCNLMISEFEGSRKRKLNQKKKKPKTGNKRLKKLAKKNSSK